MKRRVKRFPLPLLEALGKENTLGIKAGTKRHRFIGIWMVVVERRLFVRSWSIKPRSWYRTFLEEPKGIVRIAGRSVRVRAVRTRSERIRIAIDKAYRQKYHTPGSRMFVHGFKNARRRATTTELIPL